MGGVLAAILVLAGLALEGLFLFGLLARSPLVAGGGALLFLGGVLLLGRPRRPDELYATREVILLLAAGAAAGFTAATALGVQGGWRPGTLAALALGGLGETLVAVGLSVRLAMVAERRQGLFVLGVVATTFLGVLHLVLLTLSAT